MSSVVVVVKVMAWQQVGVNERLEKGYSVVYGRKVKSVLRKDEGLCRSFLVIV
jgi:hypothetical protein